MRGYALTRGQNVWRVIGARDAEEGETRTAIDERDITPLVEAARAMLTERFTHEHVFALREALQTYEKEERDG